MLFAKKNQLPKSLDVDHEFIFIEAPISIVGPAAIFWGESAWWPQKIAVRFVRTSPQELGLGAIYDIHLGKIWRQTWKAEVTKFAPDQLVERTFCKGILSGYEVIRAEERANGTRVDYELHYWVPNIAHRILWSVFWHRTHRRKITQVLGILKEYCVKCADQTAPGAVP